MVHILTGAQFADKNLLDKIFSLADDLALADKKGLVPQLLNGKVVATVFYETSTRSRLSFESAALKLGAGVISVADSKTSSASKGETVEDSVQVISGYADIVVLRHPENKSAEAVSKVSSVPIINAGDGFNEHPTQALMDLYSMQKELGKIDGLKIAFMADFRFQRNLHSLVPIFALFKNIQLYFISPKELAFPAEYTDALRAEGVNFQELDSVDSILSEIDVLYVTRVFKERFTDEAQYERLKRSFFVDKTTLSKMKNKSAILHVMPRIFEIDKEVDSDPRAAYFRQAKNGLYIRMAILLYALEL